EVMIGLVVLAFPVLAIVAIVTSMGTRERLRELERRLIGVERARPQAAPTAAQPIVAPVPPMPRPEAAAPPPTTVPAAPPPRPTPPPTAAPAQPPPSVPAAPARPAAAPEISFEERFGTRWVVWAGGIALALGGFFLVRYSIEQDLFGPRARIFFAALL